MTTSASQISTTPTKNNNNILAIFNPGTQPDALIKVSHAANTVNTNSKPLVQSTLGDLFRPMDTKTSAIMSSIGTGTTNGPPLTGGPPGISVVDDALKGIPGGKASAVAAGVVGLAAAAGFVADGSNKRFRRAKKNLDEVRASTQATVDAHIAASQRSN